MTILSRSNYTINAIVFYILILLIVVIKQPDFIYDRANNQYRIAGYPEYSPVLLGVGLAVLLYFLFWFMARKAKRSRY